MNLTGDRTWNLRGALKPLSYKRPLVVDPATVGCRFSFSMCPELCFIFQNVKNKIEEEAKLQRKKLQDLQQQFEVNRVFV